MQNGKKENMLKNKILQNIMKYVLRDIRLALFIAYYAVCKWSTSACAITQ